MLIELSIADLKNVRMPIRQYDPSLDDVRSILLDLCQFLDKEGIFRISGFGQNNWPVTIYTDLPVFLEQLHAVLKDIYLGKQTKIEFYEQGVKRIVILNPAEDFYELSCASQTNWRPNPKIERINHDDLNKMMSNILEKFLNIVQIIAPELSQHPWMQNWLCA